jgi:two-component system, LytTR family, response regulator
MIRTVLADDEVLARQKLRQFLRDEQDLEIAGECASAAETIQLVSATSPELLFLDIRMPGMDGFDVIGALTACQHTPLPHIIFTTAFDQYAVRAFEIHAVDYLLKPFTLERLRSAVQRVRERMSSTHQGEEEITSEPNHHSYTSRIVFKSRGRILFLSVDEIRWIAAEENYVRICVGGESHLLRETMSNLETRLNPHTFLRVHRSAIVNLHYVKEVKSETDGEATVVLTNGEKIAMGRSYRSRIQKLLHR